MDIKTKRRIIEKTRKISAPIREAATIPTVDNNMPAPIKRINPTIPSITFKIVGVFGERGERQILIDGNMTILEVKEKVKKEFKIVPNAKISLMVRGKRIDDDHKPIKRVIMDPQNLKISVMVLNPYS